MKLLLLTLISNLAFSAEAVKLEKTISAKDYSYCQELAKLSSSIDELLKKNPKSILVKPERNFFGLLTSRPDH
jgi:hypothetical protein